MIMRFVLLLLAVLIIPACLTSSHHWNGDSTPDGWHVTWQDKGTVSSGLYTKEQLYIMFDSQMQDALANLASTYNYLPVSYTYSWMKNHQDETNCSFTLVDDFYFSADLDGIPVDFPTAKYASGLNDGKGNITLAFWQLAGGNSSFPEMVPTGTPSWTIVADPATGFLYYGQFPITNAYPAMEYEVGHDFGINGY